jgi:hypothetical protein
LYHTGFYAVENVHDAAEREAAFAQGHIQAAGQLVILIGVHAY